MQAWTRGALTRALTLTLLSALAGCSNSDGDPAPSDASDPRSPATDPANTGAAGAASAKPADSAADPADDAARPPDGEKPADGAKPADDAATPNAPASPGEVPEGFLADAGDGWKTLITGRWKLQPGTEGYWCSRYTLKEDVAVSTFRAVAPKGTHHTLLTIADDTANPDGVGECGSNTNGTRNVLGTGVGPSELKMPAGVGMVLKAGEQLLLNLHLFNTSDQPLTGLSGSIVRLIAQSDVKHLAEEAMAGPVMLDIPVGGPTKQMGECTISHDSNIFAVGPHMHQLGIHLKAVAHSSEMGEVLLYDGAYDFDNQILFYLPQEVRMKKGDKVKVECTYQNDTDQPVKFGNSSQSEMCFAGLFRYPEGQMNFICAR
jgi:hypothetical protein